MSESETAPRFNKAILGRIFAVGLFVCLGTFAVIQSMSGKTTAENLAAAGITDDPNDPEAGKKTLADVAGNAANKISDGLANTAKSVSGAFSPSGNAKPTTGFSPNVNTNLGAKTNLPTGTNSFAGSNSNTAPQPRTFSPTLRKPATSFGDSQTAAKPPTRFAQAPSGVPIIGSNNGFAPRAENPNTDAPKATSSSFGGNSIGGRFGDAAKSVSGTTQNLKTNVTGAANDLLRKANEKTSNALGSLKQNTGFGPRPNTDIKQTTPPPTNSGFAPKVQSNFSSRTNAGTNQGASARPIEAPPRQEKSAAFDASRNLVPASPAKTSQSPFGDNSATRQPSNSGFSSRPIPPPSTNSPSSGPFGSPSGNSTSNSFANTNNSNSSPKASSNFSSNRNSIPARPASTPISNSRPTSRLGSGTTMLATPPATALTKDVPGDKQLDGVQAPALTIEKLSPREIQVNQAADFQLVVKNVGRVAAENVRVLDQVPAGTEFIGSTPQPSSMSRNRDIEWNIGTLKPGQEKLIKIQLKPTRPGEIGSVAQVTFTAQASMRTLVTKPVLEIIHQSEQTHLIGDDVIFDVIVKNKGDGPAKNVVIQEDVPKQLSVPRQLESPDGNRGIEYEIGTLQPGQSRRVKLALKAANIGKMRNVMFASADGGLQARHELPMEVVAPKLVTRTDGPTKRFLKRKVSHTFSVANNGTAPATNVELVARLPSGLRFLDANNQGRYDASAHSVFWSLAELARDVEASVELETQPVEVGTQPIKFESFADLNIRSTSEQPLSVEHLVDVFFDIDDVVDPIEIGSSTSYRVRVVNQGTKAAGNVQLQVDFPTGLQPTSVEGSLRHSINGQRIAFEPINSMSPGDEIVIVIHGKGQAAGDHRVVVNMRTDGRTAPVSKEETTRVYADR